MTSTPRICLIYILFCSHITFAQGTFRYTLEKPRPGDTVTVTYIPEKTGAVGISAYMCREEGADYEEIDLLPKLPAEGFSYSITTDSSTKLLFFTISVGKETDSNRDEGFWIQFYENSIPVKDSYLQLSIFYLAYQGETGHRKSDFIRSLKAAQRELELYPDNPDALHYVIVATRQLNPEKVNQLLLAEETRVRNLQSIDEQSFLRLAWLHSSSTQPNEQLMAEVRKLFPQGQWRMQEEIRRYYNEDNPRKKNEQHQALLKKREELENFRSGRWFLKTAGINQIGIELNSNHWNSFKKLMSEHSFEEPLKQAAYYNRAAITLLEAKKSNWPLAEEFAQLAFQAIEKAYEKLVSNKRGYIQISEAESLYADCADTYAIILEKQKKYARALPLARKAALDLSNGQKSEFNDTYVRVASKVAQPQQLLSEIERLVLDWTHTPDIVKSFRTVYQKIYPTKTDFDAYFLELKNRSLSAYSDTVRNQMTNLPSASFDLLNMEGIRVSSDELRGKIIIADFWATWCGPCIESFPGMQKAQEKYRNTPDVKFVFINTWERGSNIKRDVSNFLKKTKYPFNVLLGTETSVAKDFEIEALPTKIVLDKTGKLRYTAVGSETDEELILTEISAVVDTLLKEN